MLVFQCSRSPQDGGKAWAQGLETGAVVTRFKPTSLKSHLTTWLDWLCGAALPQRAVRPRGVTTAIHHHPDLSPGQAACIPPLLAALQRAYLPASKSGKEFKLQAVSCGSDVQQRGDQRRGQAQDALQERVRRGEIVRDVPVKNHPAADGGKRGRRYECYLTHPTASMGFSACDELGDS